MIQDKEYKELDELLGTEEQKIQRSRPTQDSQEYITAISPYYEAELQRLFSAIRSLAETRFRLFALLKKQSKLPVRYISVISTCSRIRCSQRWSGNESEQANPEG